MLIRPTRQLVFQLAVIAIASGIADRAQALPVAEVEPNDTLATAQSISNASFSLDSDANITDSTIIPHATVTGTGDGTFDYYSFTVKDAGSRGIFDIDFTFGVFDTFDAMLFLYATDGTLLASNDDIPVADPLDAGSLAKRDSYIDHTFASAGTYVIGVAETGSVGTPLGIVGDAPDFGDFYTLNISVTPVPEPATLALVGAGVVSLIGYRRRKRQQQSLDPCQV